MNNAEGPSLKPGAFAFISLAVIAVLIAALYAHTLGYPFLFDDHDNFLDNRSIRSLDSMYAKDGSVKPVFAHHYRVRALPYLSFYANYRIGNYFHAWQWRAVNIALHIVMSWLVYALAAHMFRMPAMAGAADDSRVRLASLGAALLYAAHPLQTESVVYITGRVGQIASVFYLGAFVAWLRWRVTGHARWYVVSVLFALAGMFSKETVATFPLMVLLAEWMFGEGRGWRRWRGSLAYLALLPVIPAAKWVAAGGENMTRLLTDTSRWQYMLTQTTVVARYIRLTFMPYGQCADYWWPLSESITETRVLLSIAAIAFATVMAIVAYRSRSQLMRLAAFGVFGAFLAFSIESSVFPIIVYIAEYRTYLPLAFAALAVTAIMTRYLDIRITIALLAIAIAALAGATVMRSHVWSSDKAFWSDVATKYPDNPRALNGLGNDCINKGEYKDAVLLYEKAVKLNPLLHDSWSSMGYALDMIGMPEKALEAYARALEANPYAYVARLNLGFTLNRMGRTKKAEDAYLKALIINPNGVDVAMNLGILYQDTGRHAEAAQMYERVLAIDPGNRDAKIRLAMMRIRLGR